ncbi:hypothetical protein [Clostridium sp. OS1-26]|uniref:hypothetical protein n=1 Tax=Clostridium sp. OS1-26 TaxID=3070681 RepID=UPI0027E03F5B|nr:hypothetical protein [Clostridium sp. OS1-26]WML34968.1 hypothetical protein RCG18_27640 [Clostridium sp. OS1-26]
MEGSDFYFTRELNQDYNFIILDCGVLDERHIQDDFAAGDIRLLVGSAMLYELG